ncbi:GerAB/ArcD/ProY family transporter [Paenibacillus sp. M1]|uniref:Uncharacterized protein n=2 Tax=Paenibacillus TaxID=44249 RepID=A0A3P3U069_9BACL|nr:GerAB/ArcD/ProY family transporter [Paenibacillus oralis]RRJ62938.1 hypothetical protein EHV15_08385 [Paenibacillus oralis]
MSETAKISTRQLAILATFSTVGDSILVLPAIVAGEAKKDAWISTILGLMVGLLVILLFVYVGKFNPKLGLVELNERILGRWVGTVISSLFLGYALLSMGAHLRELGDFTVTQVMPDTPIEAVVIHFNPSPSNYGGKAGS